jgi:hypothetical protein
MVDIEIDLMEIYCELCTDYNDSNKYVNEFVHNCPAYKRLLTGTKEEKQFCFDVQNGVERLGKRILLKKSYTTLARCAVCRASNKKIGCSRAMRCVDEIHNK